LKKFDPLGIKLEDVCRFHQVHNSSLGSNNRYTAQAHATVRKTL
jgi:hypothetical protein